MGSGQQQQQQLPQDNPGSKANPSERMRIAMLEGLTNKMDYVLKLLNDKQR
jgi:hypothetical protein